MVIKKDDIRKMLTESSNRPAEVETFMVSHETKISSLIHDWNTFICSPENSNSVDENSGVIHISPNKNLLEVKNVNLEPLSNQEIQSKREDVMERSFSNISEPSGSHGEKVNAYHEKQKSDVKQYNFSIKGKSIFPNGKVGQEYKHEIFFNPEEASEFGEFWFIGLGQIGLSFDEELNIVYGIPKIDGEHEVSIRYKKKDWTEGKPTFEKKFKLIINPDPRSLWKDLPSDQSGLYWKNDMSEGSLITPDRNIIAASVRGRSHAHEGKFRDDDFIFFHEADWYLIAVGDGAGSAKYSREGSRLACSSSLDYITKKNPIMFDSNLVSTIEKYLNEQHDTNRKLVGDLLYNYLGQAAFHSFKIIDEEAKKNNATLKDYATTLLLAVCRKMNSGEYFIATFWVGDGGIGVYQKGRSVRILGEPDGGEFAGQTRFLTMPEIIQPAEIYRRLRFDFLKDFTALVLMTDGITDPKFQTDKNLAQLDAWDEFWQDLSTNVDFNKNNENASKQLLEWMNFWSPGNHDDRTIAILY